MINLTLLLRSLKERLYADQLLTQIGRQNTPPQLFALAFHHKLSNLQMITFIFRMTSILGPFRR